MWIIIGLVALAIGILCWLRFKPKRGATSPDDVSITALRNAVTTAGGTPASYTYEALLRQLITAWGGTPIYFDIINLLRSGITVLGGTPASYQEVSLLRELITQLGGTPVSFNSETLYDQLATVSNSNDTTPNQFTFADYTDINTSQLQFSVTITVSGLGPGLTVTATLTGDASSRMSVDTGSGFGAFVAGPVAGLKNGDKIFLRQMSAAAGLTTVSTTLTVGTTSDTWTTTTIGVLAKPTLAINSALGATPLDLVFSTSDYVVGDYAQLWVASDSGFSTITQNIVFFIDGNSWSTKDIGIGLANPTAAYWARIRTFRDNTEGGQTTITDGNGNSYVGDVSAWSDPVNDPWTAFKGFTIATVKPSTISTGATATFTGLDLKGGGQALVYVYLNSTTATVSNVEALAAGVGGADIGLLRRHNSTSGGRQEIWVAPDDASLSCTTTSGSASVTTADTSGLTKGMSVTGTGIPANATIASITNGTTFTLSANATASGSPTLAFSGKILADGNYSIKVTPSVTLTFHCGIIPGTLMNCTSGIPTSTALKNRANTSDPKTTTSAVTVPSGGFGLSFIEDENTGNTMTVNSGTLIGSGFMVRSDLTSHATGFALSQLTSGSWTPSNSNGQLAGAWT
jgi:hypothetical protein